MKERIEEGKMRESWWASEWVKQEGEKKVGREGQGKRKDRRKERRKTMCERRRRIIEV